MGRPIPQELDDIFNIPRDGSNIKTEDESEGAYAAVLDSNSSAPFEDKAAAVAKKISQVVPPQEDVEFIAKPPQPAAPPEKKPEPPKAVEPVVEPAKPVTPIPTEGSSHVSSQSGYERILAEALPVKGNVRTPSPQVEAKPTVPDDDGDGGEDDEGEPDVRAEHERHSGSDQSAQSQLTAPPIESSDGWLLTSPAPKYNQFYAEKAWMIPRLMRGGKVPVEQYRKELSEAYVDTKVEMYDHERISEKMTEIRQWQTRVLQIRGHVLAQFHGWDRAVELFQGVLARAEYAKPAIAQQGVIYNHMRDMEMYLADLRYLQDFSKEILANLSSQFESMSRQVTLSMPLKTVERHEAPQSVPLPPPTNLPNTPKPVAKKSDLTGFDRLENDVNQKDFAAQKPNNTGKSTVSNGAPKKQLDWADID